MIFREILCVCTRRFSFNGGENFGVRNDHNIDSDVEKKYTITVDCQILFFLTIR